MDQAVYQQPETTARADRNAAAVIRAYGDLAHDLSNSILAAQTSLELIGMRATEPKLSSLADRGLSALDRAGALLEALRPLSSRRMTAPARADLAAVLRDQVPVLERLAGPGIALRVVIDMAAALVAAEAEQLELMLGNLVLNARDALSGSIEIGLGLRDDATGRRAELSVADRGTGMSAMTAARATEPYFSSRPGGVGLGLSQACAVAQRCGGSLTIDSEAGRGTTIRLQLPIAAPLP
jgi:signal transduction histidine kinase